jgi:hypothetical protein
MAKIDYFDGGVRAQDAASALGCNRLLCNTGGELSSGMKVGLAHWTRSNREKMPAAITWQSSP